MGLDPPSSFGIEEEYFLIDLATRRIPRGDVEGFAVACSEALGSLVTREMFAPQLEVVTPVLENLDQAFECLEQARATLARIGRTFGLGILAAGTHPLAEWRCVQATQREHYQQLMDDFQMVAQRSLLAGVHVHVSIPEGVDRIGVMNRVTPWLPLLLALSASSPFWEGRASGLMSYRQAACDEWPRMGVPEHFDNDADYQRYVAMLLDTGSIRTAADVWWNIRPSLRYPTLELRIADACPRLEDAVCIAGLFRAMIGYALHAPRERWVDDPTTRRITLENRWRAKRHGVSSAFIEPRERRSLAFLDWLETVLQRVQRHIPAEDAWVPEHARQLARSGSSAHAQLQAYQQARQAGLDQGQALTAVVDGLVQQTAHGRSS